MVVIDITRCNSSKLFLEAQIWQWASPAPATQRYDVYSWVFPKSLPAECVMLWVSRVGKGNADQDHAMCLQPWKHSCWWQNCCVLTAAPALPSLLPASGRENGGARQTLGCAVWGEAPSLPPKKGTEVAKPLSCCNWVQQLKEAANLGCLQHRAQVAAAEVKKSSFSTNDSRKSSQSSITLSNQPQI